MIKNTLRLIFVLSFFHLSLGYALTFHLPYPSDAVVGSQKIVQIKKGDTFYTLARRYEVGFAELAKANPNINPYKGLKMNRAIVIPTSFILPNTPRHDIVINLPEMRLYYYPPEKNTVITEPISIGRAGWETPLIETKVVEKVKDPYWVVPNSIWDYSAQKGIFLPRVVAPGPDNPLGHYALRLGDWSILIHGTNQPFHIGKRISSGCIRMYPEDIAYLYENIDVATPVSIVDQPYKIGWKNSTLYLEVHPPLAEYRGDNYEEWELVRYLIANAAHSNTRINWQTAHKIFTQRRGVPYPIGEDMY
ncbi:MAG: L,D-transpeptidase family protein [Pseudomonadota bacterium]|nr:L,D-transpeptidase family protein [Gammaproteobacteria bacterium]MBU1926303.1 L,D-transpeptidase family protein [Gammaproteobacteria bacterium]MBU2545620.1 L,D-transpeptidase family protein [Gammaproteobacteria bacterium]